MVGRAVAALILAHQAEQDKSTKYDWPQKHDWIIHAAGFLLQLHIMMSGDSITYAICCCMRILPSMQTAGPMAWKERQWCSVKCFIRDDADDKQYPPVYSTATGKRVGSS